MKMVSGWSCGSRRSLTVNQAMESEWWKGKGVHIDFTNPEAVEWFQSQLDKILDMQIDGFKIDGGSASLDMYEVKTSLGKMRSEQFGRYYYNAVAAYGMFKNPEFVNMARGYSYQGGSMSGLEFLQTTFQGDFAGHWMGLKHQIDNTYKTARLGYGAPGFEIGGFMEEKSSKPQFIRYAQFGSMCPVMDNGGANGAFSFHLPWFHGGSVINNTSFKNESHQLGPWFFIKAITSEETAIDVQLPANGNWIDYWTGEQYEPGTLLRGKQTIMIYPEGKSEYLFHRPVAQGVKYEDVLIMVDAGAGTISVESDREIEYIFLIRTQHAQEVVLQKTGRSFTIDLPLSLN